MFRGTSYHNLDSKGRLIIPTRFREVVQKSGTDGLMVSRLDSCLYAYTYNEWHVIEERILSTAETSESMRRFKRFFVGGAFDCPCDKQGRILIPPTLKQYAGLEKEVALVGVLKHFEIWSRDKLEAEELQMEEELLKADVSNEISKLGL